MTFFALIALTALGGPGISPDPAPAAPSEADTVWPSAHRIDNAAADRAAAEKAAADDTLLGAALSDEQKKAEATSALQRLEEQDRSWTAQLVRTILSLLLVIGLIYLIFKVVVPRFLGVSLPAKAGKSVRVLERTQLDARHAVVLLEIDQKQRFLVGTGEHGVQLLADLSRPAGSGARSDFQAALDRAAGSPADEDSHAKG
jgi:flagellar biogenesis protein FliO